MKPGRDGVTYQRIAAADYTVRWNGIPIGTVWRVRGSGWYYDAGNAGFTHATRWRATITLFEALESTDPTTRRHRREALA